MPHKFRDPVSKAVLFVPTHSEKAYIQDRKNLKVELEEVRKLKLELQAMLDMQKKSE